ncbi:MAG: hypothetical protein GY749_37035 [Desulfobacteraceae bacterium]|nr:hypothetical protein [Desulfobacteraceae bacterium]
MVVKNLWGKYQREMEIQVYEFEGEYVEQHFKDNVMNYKVISGCIPKV